MSDDAELAPYNLPLIPAYAGPAFRDSTATWRPKLAALIEASPELDAGSRSVWAVHYPSSGPDARGSRKRPAWTPKVYVCVRPRHYWPTIERLIERFGSGRYVWKFFWAPDGYERPDKIVFYARTEAALGRLVPQLREVIAGCGCHALRHTATTAQLGLEPAGAEGLFVGCDPDFLGGSWRMYRTLSFAWASINIEYLETLPRGGARRWFERMNLSTEHEGPATLRPDPKDKRYIRRYWRQMF